MNKVFPPQVNITYTKDDGQVDQHASRLLTLQSQSGQRGYVTPLLDGPYGVRGTHEYYTAVAEEIVSYAQADPVRCARFLAELFLPTAEKMNIMRQRALAND